MISSSEKCENYNELNKLIDFKHVINYIDLKIQACYYYSAVTFQAVVFSTHIIYCA